MGLLSRAELEGMGFAALGDDLRVSDKASFYGVPRISLGDHTRIDDFCVLSAGSGGIRIGGPPIVGAAVPMTDPLPQALVLTAIVIGFATTAFLVVLALRLRRETGSDHVDAGGDAP